MKTKKFLLPCIAAVAIATFVGAKSFKTNAYESNELLMQNVEALADDNDPEGGGTIPDYKNEVSKYSLKETKVEVKVDSTGAQVTVNYERSGFVLDNACESARKKTCWLSQVGTKVIFDKWVQVL